MFRAVSSDREKNKMTCRRTEKIFVRRLTWDWTKKRHNTRDEDEQRQGGHTYLLGTSTISHIFRQPLQWAMAKTTAHPSTPQPSSLLPHIYFQCHRGTTVKRQGVAPHCRCTIVAQKAALGIDGVWWLRMPSWKNYEATVRASARVKRYDVWSWVWRREKFFTYLFVTGRRGVVVLTTQGKIILSWLSHAIFFT